MKRFLYGLIALLALSCTSCIRTHKQVSPDSFEEKMKESIIFLNNPALNGWRLVCRPESAGTGQYVCIFSTCFCCPDSCWFAVSHDFNKKKITDRQPTIRDSAALGRAWGVSETLLLEYADSILNNFMSPIVRQIAKEYCIDKILFFRNSVCFSSTTNDWTVNFIVDTNGVYHIDTHGHSRLSMSVVAGVY